MQEARSKYGSTFAASSQKMEELGAKIRKNIQRARQYFELTEKAKEVSNVRFVSVSPPLFCASEREKVFMAVVTNFIATGTICHVTVSIIS